MCCEVATGELLRASARVQEQSTGGKFGPRLRGGIECGGVPGSSRPGSGEQPDGRWYGPQAGNKMRD